MSTVDLEKDLDAFLGPIVRGTCKEWFDGRPDIAAAIRKRSIDGAPTAALYKYLVERQDFTFGITAFKGVVADWYVQAQKERSAS